MTTLTVVFYLCLFQMGHVDPPQCVVPTVGTTGGPPIFMPYVATGVCGCAYDAYDCSDFESQAGAQLCYNECASRSPNTWEGLDVHNLDADQDGFACMDRYP